MVSICHFTSSHPPDDSRIAYKELASLAKKFDKAYLVTHQFDHSVIPIAGISYVPTEMKFPKGRLARLVKGAYKIYKTALKLDADIYHFHDPELLPFAIMLKLHGKSVIYDVHEDLSKDIASKSWLPLGLNKVIAFMANWVEKNLSRFLDGIITTCDPITKKFQPYHSRAITVHNYPDIEQFKPMFSPKKEQVCYLGTITHTRGIEQAIKACYKAEVKLVLAGHFRDEALYQRCKQLPGWQNVEWLGYLSHEDINQVMNESIAGLLLLTFSQYYQPIKLYEYMAAGIPIIASDFPQWETLINWHQLGYCVDPNDIDAISDRLKQLKQNKADSQKIGETARRFVSNHYTWQQEAIKLMNFYDLINDKKYASEGSSSR